MTNTHALTIGNTDSHSPATPEGDAISRAVQIIRDNLSGPMFDEPELQASHQSDIHTTAQMIVAALRSLPPQDGEYQRLYHIGVEDRVRLQSDLDDARAEARRMDAARNQFLGERNMLAEALRDIQRGDMTNMMELTEAEAAKARAGWALKKIGQPVAALTAQDGEREQIERLTAERDEADRRAGAAERGWEADRDTLATYSRVRDQMKEQRGFDRHVSFDKVWADTCAKADRAEKAEAERDAIAAAAFEAVAQWLIDAGMAGDAPEDPLASCIRAQAPADAKAALDRMVRDAEVRGQVKAGAIFATEGAEALYIKDCENACPSCGGSGHKDDAALTAQPVAQEAAYHCDRCGRGITMDAVVSHDLWAQISPTGDDGGLLCASCMADAIASATDWPAIFMVNRHDPRFSQPVAQEPVAYLHSRDDGSLELVLAERVNSDIARRRIDLGWKSTPLYAHPALNAKPVAWHLTDIQGRMSQSTDRPADAEAWRNQGLVVTPLYAHPATPAPVEAGLALAAAQELARIAYEALEGPWDEGTNYALGSAIGKFDLALRAQSAPVGGEVKG